MNRASCCQKASLLWKITLCALYMMLAFTANSIFTAAQGPTPQGWSTNIRVTNTHGDSYHTDAAMSPAGNVNLAIEDISLGYPQVWYTQLDSSGNSVMPFRRVSFTGNHAMQPDIAIDGANNVFVAWTSVRDTNVQQRDIVVRRISSAGTSMMRSVTQDGISQFPAIAINRQSGDVYIVFQKPYIYNGMIRWQAYFAKLDNNLNVIVPPQQMRGLYPPDGKYADLAVGPDGTVHAVMEWGFFGRYIRLDPTGQPIGSEVQLWGPGTTWQENRVIGPKIAVDQQNNAHIVFTTPLHDPRAYPSGSPGAARGGYAVYVKIRNGQIATGPTRAHIPSASDYDYGAENADVAVDEPGRASIVVQTYEYGSFTSSSKVIYYMVDAQGVVSPAVDLGLGGWGAEAPAIVANAGKVFVAWDDMYGVDNREIFLKIKS